MASKMQKQVVSSMIWRFGERFLAQIVTFVVSVVLARLLTPKDYGNIAILIIFIDLMDVFVVHGFGTALVQKKNAEQIDFSSVFFFNLIFTMILYVVMFCGAPILGNIFDNSRLSNLFRVLALRIPLAGINSVQHAYVQRKMVFKKFFFATLGGTLASAILGITLAYLGAGAWALVAQYLCNSFCDTVILWLTVKWRPSKEFSWKRLSGLLSFGWKMLGSQLIHVIYNKLSSFVIGTKYSSTDLAYYEQGSKIPGVIETNIDTTINSVLFPAMSKAQDNIFRLKQMVQQSIRISTLIVCPLMVGLMVVSSDVVSILYTEKWLPCVVFMQVACLKLIMEPIQTANLQAVKALGRSDLYIKMEFIKKGYGLVTLILTMRISVFAIAIGFLSQSMFSFLINSVPNKKLLNYGYIEQLKDVLPNIVLSMLMGGVVYLLGKVLGNSVLELFAKVVFGGVFYIGLVFLFRKNDFLYVFDLIKGVFRKD